MDPDKKRGLAGGFLAAAIGVILALVTLQVYREWYPPRLPPFQRPLVIALDRDNRLVTEALHTQTQEADLWQEHGADAPNAWPDSTTTYTCTEFPMKLTHAVLVQPDGSLVIHLDLSHATVIRVDLDARGLIDVQKTENGVTQPFTAYQFGAMPDHPAIPSILQLDLPPHPGNYQLNIHLTADGLPPK